MIKRARPGESLTLLLRHTIPNPSASVRAAPARRGWMGNRRLDQHAEDLSVKGVACAPLRAVWSQCWCDGAVRWTPATASCLGAQHRRSAARSKLMRWPRSRISNQSRPLGNAPALCSPRLFVVSSCGGRMSRCVAPTKTNSTNADATVRVRL